MMTRADCPAAIAARTALSALPAKDGATASALKTSDSANDRQDFTNNCMQTFQVVG
jgi:hypothetical protein